MASRVRRLAAHACIGERENSEVDQQQEGKARASRHPAPGKQGPPHPVLRFAFVREAIKIVFKDPSAADERYGGAGDSAIIEGELIKPNTESETVLVFMHPSGIMNLLPMPVAMARAGLHVVTCTSRYPNNDTCLIMEKVAIDLGACVRHVKKLGYKKVLLCGWSGGGSLSAFYQAQAELGPRALTHTPAGDRVDLPGARLAPADGLLIMAAHVSRAKIFTEWLDPAVVDEATGARDPELDLWDPANPNRPPFTPEYVRRFREAQVARNRRITAWAREQLRVLEEREGSSAGTWRQGQRDLGFVVQCTQADLRRVDTTLDPNGRKPTSLLELAKENHSPVGLARFTTLRSWLSQWSYDDSNADGPESLKHVTCPVFVLANEADHLVPLSHPRAMYEAVPHADKEYHLVPGAEHYYLGQLDLLAGAVERVIDYLRRKGLLEPSFKEL